MTRHYTGVPDGSGTSLFGVRDSGYHAVPLSTRRFTSGALRAMTNGGPVHDPGGSTMIRVLSVPSGHVYVRHLSDSTDDGVVRLPDPPVPGPRGTRPATSA